MQPAQDAPSTGNAGEGPVYGLSALIEAWKTLTVTAGVAAVVAVIVATALHQRYEASVTLSTVTSQRSLPLGTGLAAQLLNLSGSGGMQATPVLVARLTRLQSVLLAVGAYKAPADSGATIMDRLAGTRDAQRSNATILKKMGRVISPSWDRESGLVTIRVVHRDSSLARDIVDRTVDEISRVFRQASRAQATELRDAQQARLDSAERQLRHAEQYLVDFLASNRVITQHSTLQAQLQSRQRAVDIAQSVYLQVRTEREAAVGKELEETPSVVVLDSLPEHLPRVAVSMARVVVFAIVMGFFLGAAIVLLRERSRDQLASDPAARRRLVHALSTLPVVGDLLARRVGPPRE